jgi:hypothetical protein
LKGELVLGKSELFKFKISVEEENFGFNKEALKIYLKSNEVVSTYFNKFVFVKNKSEKLFLKEFLLLIDFSKFFGLTSHEDCSKFISKLNKLVNLFLVFILKVLKFGRFLK